MKRITRCFCWLSVLLVPLLLLTGCESAPEEPETEPVEEDVSGFGDPYQIVSTESPDAPEQPPYIDSDTLHVGITYPGGCENHAFAVGHRTERDTARLWIHHDAGGETCSTQVRDEIRAPVPSEVTDASTVILETPKDSVPFVLRFGR